MGLSRIKKKGGEGWGEAITYRLQPCAKGTVSVCKLMRLRKIQQDACGIGLQKLRTHDWGVDNLCVVYYRRSSGSVLSGLARGVYK